MPAKGSCCPRCGPCEAEVQSCEGVCLTCLPRRLCASVTASLPAGFETCCPMTFGVEMRMECDDPPRWGGVGTCGVLSLSLTVYLTDNDASNGCTLTSTCSLEQKH